MHFQLRNSIKSIIAENLNAYFWKTSGRGAATVVPCERFESVCLKNEPILNYDCGSKERDELEKNMECFKNKCEVIPIVINGKQITSDNVRYQVMPHCHSTRIAKFYYANPKQISDAIEVAVKAQQQWDQCTTLAERCKIWEKAADLMSEKYRADLVVATMLGQSKTVFQAEIDAAAELIDFMRMNAAFSKMAANYEPISQDANMTRNFLRFRGIDGFIAAITPFNFTAIGGNLAYTPALMGNAVIWKPSDTAMLASWNVFKIMQEAGVPDGVVNFVPADGPTFGKAITSSPHLAGINFTGSVKTFDTLWKLVADNVEIFNNYPRLVGECGGKNFHFVHSSANVDTVIATTIRSAFEYGGQKCSACSRMYVPKSLWDCKIKGSLVDKTCKLLVGDVRDFKSFLSAVIDDTAFLRIVDYIEYANSCKECEIIVGGKYSNLKGYFIDPTIVVVSNPENRLFKEEIFGPLLSVYVYEDNDLEKTMDLIVKSRKYALTGAIFGEDEQFLKNAVEKFKNCAGNFYINDKSTGAVVGQQPFGGGRKSGTNDKAGGPHYVLRWTSPQSIKETYCPMTDIYYSYMGIPKEDACKTEAEKI